MMQAVMEDRRAKVKLEPSWLEHLGPVFETEPMVRLKAFLAQEQAAGKTIYPPNAQIFNALNTTPFDKVRVVIIGQDPYHGEGQAHGLSFSVQDGVQFPPSLQNIFQEIQQDLGVMPKQTGNLLRWAQQGVLLLNSVLTVEAHKANSHQNKGWEYFTDAVIQKLSDERDGLVFLLWGAYAQKKGQSIDRNKHFVLKAPHPSPLSAYRGFFGCRHFSQANQWLESRGLKPVDWS